jgi:transcriptional antiterminator Rof (Rho-off)
MTCLDCFEVSVYQPVSCGLHSEYELLAMHQSRVRLGWIIDEQSLQSVTGKVVDVVTRKKAEYLVLEVTGTEASLIRLDKIRHLEKI